MALRPAAEMAADQMRMTPLQQIVVETPAERAANFAYITTVVAPGKGYTIGAA